MATTTQPKDIPMNTTVYDFIAIGLGPFNLGLACLTDPIDELNGLFLEARSGFDWHPGMMLESALLQTPFMSDLVTLADPTHPLSFLNYAKQQGKLYSFYIREDFFLMRLEYNQYCRWAIDQLSSIRFEKYVEDVHWDEQANVYQIQVNCLQTKTKEHYMCKNLIIGTGPVPWQPKCCPESSDNFIHSSQYLFEKQNLQTNKSITVIGGGQSGAEIYYDLLQEIDQHQYQLNWVTRSPRFFPLEYSKLTLEMTSPEYVDYFYNLPQAKKDTLVRHQKNLYKGVNSSLINDIYDLLYVKKLSGEFDTNLLTNSRLESVNEIENNVTLTFEHVEQEQYYQLETNKVILATGYQYQAPDFLQNISDKIQWDNLGRFKVARNYTIDKNQRIFVQNAEFHTHGFVTPDLGMACYRNSHIICSLLGREYYPVEKKIAFQQFDVTDLDASPAVTHIANPFLNKENN